MTLPSLAAMNDAIGATQAALEFLADFSERELLDYLEHLQTVYGLPSLEPSSQPALVA